MWHIFTAGMVYKGCRSYPSIFEGPLIHLCGLLLEFLDDTLVNATKLVDQVSGGSGLAGIDMTDNDDVKMCLFLTHFSEFCGVPATKASKPVSSI